MTTKEEIIVMKKDISNLSEKIDGLDEKMDMIIKKLLDPDSGLVVRVNKNTERLDYRDEKMPEWMGEIDQFRLMKSWKSNINKALWVLYSAAIGLIIKVLFWS
tara:strand:+ start:180 stop:488 length:309 start_codon:yes stop_codon:yes gene_type:complete